MIVNELISFGLVLINFNMSFGVSTACGTHMWSTEMELNGEDKVNRICVDALEVMKKWSSRLKSRELEKPKD